MQGFLPGLWNNGEVENHTNEGDPAISPEGAIKAEELGEINKSFDPQERAEVAEGGGDGSAEGTVFEGEDFAEQEPGDWGDPCGEGELKEEDADEGNVVEAALHPVGVGFGDIVVESKDSEAGQSKGHNEAGDNKERPPAQLVREDPGEAGGNQLGDSRHNSSQVRVDVREHLAEDGHGIEVECDDAREAVEEHEGGGDQDRLDELWQKDKLAVDGLLAAGSDVYLDRRQLCTNVCRPASQPLQRPLSLLDLVRVEEIGRGLWSILDGHQQHERSCSTDESQLTPVEPGAHQKRGEEAEVGEDLQAGGQPASQGRRGDLTDVHLGHQHHHRRAQAGQEGGAVDHLHRGGEHCQPPGKGEGDGDDNETVPPSMTKDHTGEKSAEESAKQGEGGDPGALVGGDGDGRGGAV